MTPQNTNHHKLPKRIILVRHGESKGNIDTQTYSTTPDHKVPLTPLGTTQARTSGHHIRHLLDVSTFDEKSSSAWRVYFYVSPYERARSTLREIGRSFPKRRVIGVREECRIREQDFGNFQVKERMVKIKEIREMFGRFFYRFPEGESAADVYDRVSSFMESMWRDIDMNRLHHDPDHEFNLIIVTHGLLLRVFLMKWFKWTVEQFELLNNPGNGEYRVMELGEGGEYSLAINHSEEEMLEWGLSPEMIADQKWRAQAKRGEWNEKCTWYLDGFFDHLEDSGQNSEDDSCVSVGDGSKQSDQDSRPAKLERNNHIGGEDDHIKLSRLSIGDGSKQINNDSQPVDHETTFYNEDDHIKPLYFR